MNQMTGPVPIISDSGPPEAPSSDLLAEGFDAIEAGWIFPKQHFIVILASSGKAKKRTPTKEIIAIVLTVAGAVGVVSAILGFTVFGRPPRECAVAAAIAATLLLTRVPGFLRSRSRRRS